MNLVDEFRFPCFVDICTFPIQYCNSDPEERRCNSCTDSICKSDFIPDPCKYHCKSLNSVKTSTTTTLSPSTASATPSSICSEAIPDIPTHVWTIIVLLTVIIAVLIAIVIILFVSRRKTKLPNEERMEQGAKQEMKQLIKKQDSVSDCSDLPDSSPSSTTCSGPISHPEDSVHGNSDGSSGPPPYPNESTKFKEEHQICTKSKKSEPIQCSRSSNPTLAFRGDLCDSSLFISSSEGHIPQRNHCCRELDSRKSDK
ncbi:hypothetical protein ACJMK2_033791 [Sinanodonta woodiana]|uniref:Uncharacterized protein n=1 Tax=Sinanodonta woodiana TaxID=1069815 RepID=A0ABD3WPG5_SINWO